MIAYTVPKYILMLEPLYHITSSRAWNQAKQLGTYKPQNFEQERFVHCSYLHQLTAVANRLFHGRTDLLVLVIDPSKLECDIVGLCCIN
jgi:uncharacterized protein (DUF952 family)